MAIILNDNLKINAGKPIDNKYLSSTNVPYVSVAAVNSAIPISERYIGLKVNINNIEYWYYSGLTNTDLFPFETPSSVSGVTNALNGLTLLGDDTTIVLGGALTGNTIVDLNSYGLVLGSGGTASGNDSLVLVGGTAEGNCSISAIGGHSIGNSSWAVGAGAVSSGACSVAFGSAKAIGAGSLAIGGGSCAVAANSTLIGGNSKTCGFGSFALGSFNIAYGAGSFALGSFAHAHGANSFAFGKGEATGNKEIQACGLASINFSTNTTAQIADSGADADYSIILGGINHQICVGNVGASILGRCGTTGIRLTGSSYQDHVIVTNLGIWSAPSDNATGSVLVWDSATKKVGKSTVASLGGITGATNGLQKLGQKAGLGGILTEALTTISGSNKNLSIGTVASPINLFNQQACCSIMNASICNYIASTQSGGDIVIDAQNSGEITIKSQTGSTLGDSFTGAVGFSLDYSNNLFKVVDNRTGSNRVGIEYQTDYSNFYTNRSLVDKAYVDSVAAGLDAKDAVVVATTAGDGNIDVTGGTFVSGTTLDGIVVQDGWRVLVKNQTVELQNGIWVYSASTSGFTRSEDFDGTPSGEVSNGAFTTVITGDTLANSQWIVTTPDPITVDVTDINWSLLSQQLGIVGGTGITVTTLNSLRTISTKLAGVSSLSYDGGLGLRVDSSIAGSGLTMTNGIIDVNASSGAITGTELAVHFGTNNDLFIDSDDVVAALGTPISSASNGLTKVGTDVRLGGNLTGNTTINGTGLYYDLTLASLGTFSVTINQTGSTITDNSSGGGLHYATDYSGDFVGRSLVDADFVTGITSGLQTQITSNTNDIINLGNISGITNVSITGVTNGLLKVGSHSAKLGGAPLSENTTIGLGGFGIALGSGSTIANYVNVNNLAITASPSTGTFSDGVLVWNSGDKLVKQVNASVIGGVTGATNGLNVNSAKRVGLGGTLTGNTTIVAGTYGLALGSSFSSAGNGSLSVGNNVISNYLSIGFGDGTGYGGTEILSCGIGSLAFGKTYGSYSNIRSTNFGTFAGGSVLASNSCIAATGRASFAFGYAIGNTSKVQASGAGSIAMGLVTGATNCVIASALGSVAIGTQSKATANNAVAIGNNSCADAINSAVLGGNNNTVETGNVNSVIIGGNNITLSASNYPEFVAVPNLAIFTAPSTGTFSDGILVWDSADNIVKQVASTVIGGITGVTNGLNVNSAKRVGLGGTLTGNTTIAMGGFGMVIGSGSSVANFVKLNNLAITANPLTGVTTDNVLVWNSSDKKVKQVPQSSLGEYNNKYAITGVTTNVTATTTNYVIVVDTSGGAKTVYLPAAPVTGQAYKIKDNGNALTNTITIAGSGNDIDGGTSASINTDYGALEVVFDGTEWWTLAFIN